MTLVVPNAGEVVQLTHALGKTAIEDLTLKLYKSNTTPAESDTAGTYTEADFSGYAATTLTGSDWTITGGAPTEATQAEDVFESDADQTPQTIYGYFVVGASSGTIYWAERFASSQVVQFNGDIIRITPKYTGE